MMIMSIPEFEARIKNGEKLAILDDMVLDLTDYMVNHPGGKFSLAHNIGRDVSKFFYGGYSLENQNKVENHVHSNDARRVVNTLIVGKLERDAAYRVMVPTAFKEWANANKSGTTKTIKFVTESADPQNYRASSHSNILNNTRSTSSQFNS